MFIQGCGESWGNKIPTFIEKWMSIADLTDIMALIFLKVLQYLTWPESIKWQSTFRATICQC
jgi:hypothetical protein